MRALRRPNALDALTLAAIAVLAIVHELLIRHSGFFLDDFRNLADARHFGLGWHLLTTPVFEHFAPGHRVMDWLAAEPLGHDFRWASLLETGWFALLLAAFAGLMRTLWGRSAWHLLPLAILGLAWSPIATDQWFAAGAHVTPALALTVLSLLLAARWGQNGRAWEAVASVVVGFCGVLFWVQTVVAPLLALLVLTIGVDQVRTPRGLLESLRRRALFLVPYFAVMVAFLVWLGGRPYRTQLGTPAFDQVLTLAKVVVVRGVGPALLGRELPNEQLSGANSAWQVAALVAFAALLALAVTTRRRWVSGLVMIGGAYIGVVATIATGRLAQVGAAAAGNEPRYVAFLVPMVLLGLVAMLQPTGRTTSFGESGRTRAALAAGGVLLVCLAALNLPGSSDRSYWRGAGVSGKMAANELGPQLAKLDSESGRRLVNGELKPPFWYEADRGSDNTVARLIRYFSPSLVPLGDSSGGSLLRIDGAAVAPVAFRPAGPAVRLSCRPGGCVTELNATGPIASGAYAQIRSSAADIASAEIEPLDGTTTKDDPRAVLDPHPPARILTAPVWATGVTRVRVSVTVSAPSTVHVALGTLAPR